MKKEELMRRLGLIFTILTLAIQLLVVFQPSESANAGEYISEISSLDVICKDKKTSCMTDVKKSIAATNMSQGFDENTASETAYSGDHINYTVTVENIGESTISAQIETNLSDTLEYSDLIVSNGGTLDQSSKKLSWPEFELKPEEEQTRTFVVKILDNLPATAQGIANPNSYDCRIQNVFGNSISIKVDCPAPKILEAIINKLPKVGIMGNMLFACILLAISYFYLVRVRQLEKEVRIIRKNISSGTL